MVLAAALDCLELEPKNAVEDYDFYVMMILLLLLLLLLLLNNFLLPLHRKYLISPIVNVTVFNVLAT